MRQVPVQNFSLNDFMLLYTFSHLICKIPSRHSGLLGLHLDLQCFWNRKGWRNRSVRQLGPFSGLTVWLFYKLCVPILLTHPMNHIPYNSDVSKSALKTMRKSTIKKAFIGTHTQASQIPVERSKRRKRLKCNIHPLEHGPFSLRGIIHSFSTTGRKWK